MSLLLIAALSITLLAGCFSKDSDATTSGPQVLRILGGYGDDEYLRREWVDVFEIAHDNIEVEIIPLHEPYNPNQPDEEREDPQERIKRLLTEGIPPDVILLDSDISTLSLLVEEGLVQPLETYLEKSNIQVDQLVPAIREGIKAAGDGTSMYALAPTFTSQALFYNKDLFDQYGVPYPTDNMTWAQIADLAKQFPKGEEDDRIYGLWSRNGYVNFYEFMYNFAAPLNLKMFDAEGEKVAVDTPEWEAALTEYMNLYIDEVLPISPQNRMSESGVWEWTPEMEQFSSAMYNGRAAMAIIDSWELSNLANRRMYDPEAGNFAWDLVTVPTHADAPGIGGSINYGGLMAINRNSQNANLAWDYIQFYNSEKMLKIKSRNQGQFVSVAELNQVQGEGPANLQAFFALAPAMDSLRSMYNSNNENMWMVYSIANDKLQEVLNGQKTVPEILAEIQTEGQDILDSEPEVGS